MTNFLIFYAPFLVVLIGIILAFLWAPRDYPVTKNDSKGRS